MKQFKIGQQIESEIVGQPVGDNEPFGPRDDIEFARVLRDIRESWDRGGKHGPLFSYPLADPREGSHLSSSHRNIITSSLEFFDYWVSAFFDAICEWFINQTIYIAR